MLGNGNLNGYIFFDFNRKEDQIQLDISNVLLTHLEYHLQQISMFKVF